MFEVLVPGPMTSRRPWPVVGRLLRFARGLVAVAGILPYGATSADANRLVYLDSMDPFHVGTHFPRLTTPQWIGEPGVDVAVTLGIDDMSGTERYEEYLRPILERLKQIDGRAPVSIFCNAVNPEDPRLQSWLSQGLSLEVHTLSHPCPILSRGDFNAASNTFHGGVDLLNRVPNSAPVAFRTPCCDSIDSASPRLFAELLARTNAAGQFLRMDSSVAMLLTTNDPALPTDRLVEAGGTNRFAKYVPFPAFKTTIENYPYPYVHSGGLWEMPFVVPSDWESQHIQGDASPRLVEDWTTALDLIALKQGVFNFIFHPARWSSPAQHVAFIDHAVRSLGPRVRFLNYREVHERLTMHLLAGQPLRAADGGDNGVRLIDLDDDGFLDVVIGNNQVRRTRLWNPATRSWKETSFPVSLLDDSAAGGMDRDAGVRFGIIHSSGEVSCLVRNGRVAGAWTFRDGAWVEDSALLNGLELDGRPVATRIAGRDAGLRLRDVDGEGGCECLVAGGGLNAIFRWDDGAGRWRRHASAFPAGVSLVNAEGGDNGVRFADLNGDGHDDLLVSNESQYGVWLYVPEPFLGWSRGWTRKVMSGDVAAAGGVVPGSRELPPFVRAGRFRNNGAWIHSGSVWWQNEDTASLPNHVDRRSFDQLLTGVLPPPKSPVESLSSIRVPPGFEVELVAAEPLVRDPIALDWGADGRLWIVEMRDYPLGVDGNGKPGGVVKFLEDTDGDGRYDRATEFLRDVNFPTGVMPWRQGVLVSAAPEIFHAEDTDGDGVADRRVTLFRGFVEGNQQHRLNGFCLGLDGWVYGANGDSGGDIASMGRLDGQSLTTPLPAVSIRGRDFRFRPDTGEFEAVEGQTQYGRWRDDWGHWFGNANYAWLWTYPLPARQLARNPHLAVRDLRKMLADYDGGNRVHPLSRPLQRPNVVGDENTVTSANSPTPYRDDLFGPDFAGSVFISEPTENLVHREVVFESGSTLSSRRAKGEEHSEFLASTDNWFRPIQTRTGPDGALYVVDMYRLSIEHPEWIPKDLQARLDLRAGEDRGRIYRVAPKGAERRRFARLDRLETAGLVAAMESPNGWQRDTAMRLLVERRDASARTGLVRLVRMSVRPEVRLQALCALDALGIGPDPETLGVALKDSHAAVRAQAMRVLGERVAQSAGGPASAAHVRLLDSWLGPVQEASASVRLQLAFALGASREPRAAGTLVELVRRAPGDGVLLQAVMSSAVPHVDALLRHLASEDSAKAPGALMEPLVTLAARLGRDAALDAGLRWALKSGAGGERVGQFRTLSSCLEAMSQRGREPSPEVLDQLGPVFEQALQAARDEAAAIPLRVAALQFATRRPGMTPAEWDQLGEMLSAGQPWPLQQAALAAFQRGAGAAAPGVLIRCWPTLSPNLRGAALDALLSRRDWTLALLDAVDGRTLAAGDFNATARQRLMNHKDDAVRRRAAAVFGAVDADRAKVLTAYDGVAGMRGDAERGRAHFVRVCASCHRLRGEGFAVGPDLAAVGDKSPGALLISILDPNRSVAEPFMPYTAETRSGTEWTGIIAGETPNSVTLKMPNGIEETLLRSDLVRLTSGRRSLMPDGLEAGLDLQAMADLVAFVAGSGPPPKAFPGNHPAVVRTRPDGAYELTAASAEIYGDTLVFEGQYRNLGYWQSDNDWAVWSVEVTAGGEFDVWLDGASPDSAPRRSIRVEVGDQAGEWTVPGTASWDEYRPMKLGRLRLEAGSRRVVVRGVRPVTHAFLDLRELRLVPAGKEPGGFGRP